MSEQPMAEFYQNESAYIRPTDTVGAAFLGILSIILLIALLQSESRYRKLYAQVHGLQAR